MTRQDKFKDCLCILLLGKLHKLWLCGVKIICLNVPCCLVNPHVVFVIDNFMINLNLLEDQPVRLLHGISQARLVAVSTQTRPGASSFSFSW
jgi:hypothetical protein